MDKNGSFAVILKQFKTEDGVVISLLQEGQFSFVITARSQSITKILLRTESKSKAKKEFLEYFWTMN